VSNSEEQRLQVDAPLPPAPWPCPLALRAARVVVRCTGQCVECFTWIPLSSHRTKVPLKSTTDSQSLMRFTQQITAWCQADYSMHTGPLESTLGGLYYLPTLGS
jgi:hypothetical protein